jgi:L-ascorbate metabolism protein UlaG (beta-lactamase superfamily)
VRTSPLYLRQNVKAEPLFNQWYAWPHLISPANAAIHIANSHLKIMKSYLAAPQVHAAMLKNPAMLGGPFIDHGVDRVAEIRALMEKTAREQAHLVRFAESVKELDDLLRNEAHGHTLEPLYPKVPDNLKGYVELVYDLNNNPSIRFIEGLLYQSNYYDPSLQSVSLSLVENDDRPFALSTPRLPDAAALQLNLPFNHEGIKALFALRQEPQPFEYIAELLGLPPGDEQLFRSFLTEEGPPPRERYSGNGVRVRYFGHACLLLETSEVSILTDPVLSYVYAGGIQRFTYADLPEVIDYVLITHAHQDHIMLESLLQLRHRAREVIVPRNRGGSLQDPSLKMALRNIGFERVVELDEMETISAPGGSIVGLPFLGEHADLNVGSKLAYRVLLNGTSFLMAADSNNVEPQLYQKLFKALGDLDVLFLGMECDGAPLSWVYGPLLTKPIDRKMDQSRRLSGSDYEKAIAIVDQFKCKHVYVYAMGQEPWLNYVMCIKYSDDSNPIVASNKLIEECRRRGIVSERLFGQKEMIF